MTKKNKYIETFSTIYGIDLVVANKNVTTKDLQKLYINIDNTELTDPSDEWIAFTTHCKNKKTNRYTILVRYIDDTNISDVDKKLDLINSAAHEAIHVVMGIYSSIGEEVFPKDSNEILANHVAWATQCIYEVWTKK